MCCLFVSQYSVYNVVKKEVPCLFLLIMSFGPIYPPKAPSVVNFCLSRDGRTFMKILP